MKAIICTQCGGNKFGRFNAIIKCLYCDTIYTVEGFELITLDYEKVRIPEVRTVDELFDFILSLRNTPATNTILLTTTPIYFERVLKKVMDGEGRYLLDYVHGTSDIYFCGYRLIIE